jgi:hypothetical protein
LKTGAKLSHPNIDWSKRNRSLLIFLSEGCHYCSDSAAFYRKLIDRNKNEDFQLIALFPSSIQSGKKYLEEVQVPVTYAVEAQFDNFGSMGIQVVRRVRLW